MYQCMTIASRHSTARTCVTGFRGRTEQLDSTVVKTRVEWNGAQVTTHDAFSFLAGEATFRSGLISALRSAASIQEALRP
jgi:hypothetical protein